MARVPKYKNPDIPFSERADDLISRMSLRQKVRQMLYRAPKIRKLGIPKYHWWNEALHGVARAGIATVFPQSIGLAASFNDDLMFDVAMAISDEGRAKHHEFARNGKRGRYKGLTFWSPNVNIFRDPRWGRGQETYGECPYLSARMGVAFVNGLQGDDPRYLKSVATPKHFVVHSGPEDQRHHFNAISSKKDMEETYLPAFRSCVEEAGAESVMCAYNRTNDELCCASPTLLQNILRDRWGFAGYVVSDCGAIRDFHKHHNVTDKKHESAALAVKNGCDLNCGWVFRKLRKAVRKGLITEQEIDVSLKRLMLARFKLGMFDPPELCKYQNIPYSVNDCEEHRKLALEAARQTLILLKNENSILPIDKNVKSIAVIGPNMDNYDALVGNYNGTPSEYSTPLQGILKIVDEKFPGLEVTHTEGCALTGTSESDFMNAVQLAANSDIVIACMGISPKIEGEESRGSRGDREDLLLPEIQRKLLNEIHKVNKNIVLVLLNGSPIAFPWSAKNLPGIIEAWYPGEEGGKAIAEVLFGVYSPAGRLPLTFVKNTDQLPPFEDYSMQGRTYRYMKKEPLYPFGFGLSYTKFEYSDIEGLSNSVKIGHAISISFNVKNIGTHDGSDVIQVYIKHHNDEVISPLYDLVGFKRVWLKSGESKSISFDIQPERLSIVRRDGSRVIVPENISLYVGGCLPDELSCKLMGNVPKIYDVLLTGNEKKIREAL